MGDKQQLILNSDVIYALTRNLPNPELISDETSNNSDKTLTVPANQIWEILSIWIVLNTTADSGNRLIILQFRNDSDVIFIELTPTIDHAASLTKYYLFAPGLPRETSFFGGNKLFYPFPSLSMPAGFNVRVFDTAVIAPTADDMTIQIMINRYDVP